MWGGIHEARSLWMFQWILFVLRRGTGNLSSANVIRVHTGRRFHRRQIADGHIEGLINAWGVRAAKQMVAR